MACLDQPITSIMQHHIVSVGLEDTVHAVEEIMEQHNVTSVPVIDTDRHDCYGIISLKDIQHFHTKGGLSRATRAWEMCTYKPLVANIDTTVQEVAQIMIGHGIHHIAVIDPHKKVVGFLSTLDVLSSLLAGNSKVEGSQRS
jgi:predicted transcriptional regulator